jgi:hypothetical protein
MKYVWKKNQFNGCRLYEIEYLEIRDRKAPRRRKLCDSRYVNSKYQLETVRYNRSQ